MIPDKGASGKTINDERLRISGTCQLSLALEICQSAAPGYPCDRKNTRSDVL